MKRKTFIFLCLLFVLTACNTEEEPLQSVESFTFEDQNGRPFHSNQLEGEPWIASFLFTNCETVCPPMTKELASLKDTLKKVDLDITFVSFSVDPHIDTPKKVKEFLSQFTEDQENWHFLTGYSQERIEQFALENFQTIVQKPPHSSQVIHGTNFFLVNGKGQVIGEYSYTDEGYLKELLEDLKGAENLQSFYED